EFHVGPRNYRTGAVRYGSDDRPGVGRLRKRGRIRRQQHRRRNQNHKKDGGATFHWRLPSGTDFYFGVRYQKGMTIVNAIPAQILIASSLMFAADSPFSKFAESREGMAATTTPSATSAAAHILASGGNAIDAAA